MKGGEGMDIQTAIIKAKEEGKGITRESWGARRLLIIPTNTTCGFIVWGFEEKIQPGRGWQPQAKDILANDWIVYG